MRSTFRPSSSGCLVIAILAGAVAAGTVSTLVQLALWFAVGEKLPDILWRDARLTAALVLGEGVLPPPATFDWLVLAVSTGIHFALSTAYSAAFCLVARYFGWQGAAGWGALLGVVLYFVNLYGFTYPFPWFAAARGDITLAAHVAFGMSATMAGKWALARCLRAR